ncbi:putative trans-sialidase, Group II [Trypanosoma cruzi]|uniref:Trans-sialidase, putative n=2 Tax=Trypanosoma cruzi TaxID=5693 RepID=Q4DDU4_TRYCC|nr:trans-sialidase, putative [Trypanosoma cruzi]XP_821769.1 trans-sialidase, putative [Trypanosoma cruzi]EAN90695.1 trans-sialidase, putative [Trypanosoma cruzi]EAN99918.1 trans-sialidase, putative [Trypanosoma cruzi]PWV21186.1 putative trans-sialidase, Group II [Trypanosoma cruzi]|eukprot:XP_812546.1 trans-sialidase [Trypanosoma cruzi strain CL Brener]
MLSRVAAVKAPRTHNRRRVTGSSGRRREGGESEPQRPNMSRRVFTFAVLLLLVVMICCATCVATPARENDGNSDLRTVEGLQWVDLFVPNQTQVLPKGGGTPGKKRDSFVSPSLVSAGGVIAAFARGKINPQYAADVKLIKPLSSDIVAGYIDSSWEWSTLVEKVSESTWKAHTVLGTTDGTNRVGDVLNPTTTTKGNKVFLLAAGFEVLNQSDGNWKRDRLDLKLVVGDVTKPTSSEPTGSIKWGTPTSLSQTNLKTPKAGLKDFDSSGVSGVVMEDGTLVFPMMAKSEEEDVYSMIIYSTDNGSIWALSEDMSPAECLNPRITEWEGSLLMIVDCENGQRVYESRDMGTAWTEAIGKLPGVWTNSQPEDSQDESLHVDALITATIEGRKVMLYIQRGYASEEYEANALYLWVTDNNRSFYFGPVGMDTSVEEELAGVLLYSDGNLHLLQQRDNDKGSALSLSRLTEELSTVKFFLSTWTQKDIFFSSFSIPTAGLVAVLSDAASDDTWYDEYLCLNATVRNAKKVKDGFQLTEPSSRVSWSVNIPDDNVRHISLSHDFTLVASVIIEVTPSGNTPLLTATMADTNSNHTMGVSYTADNKWGKMFEDKITTESRPWEPKKEYQVVLMLQGNKASVYVDGKLLGEEETMLTGETPLGLVRFCFGACEIHNFPVTVKNVFLYSRPLNPTEMRAIKERRHIPRIEGVRAKAPAGSGLLPLLLLLGLWVFAAL